jgi:DNA-binding transcriptional LysR family regulator
MFIDAEAVMKTAVRFTWNQLRIFDAVARLSSHTRAAAELHVVQPTISAQIKQLSSAVGMPLFEQIGKKIFLTPAGRELHATCGELFDCWSRFEMKVADIKGVKTGTLRVAIVTTAKYFIPRLLGPFCRLYPGIDVELEVVNRDQVIERLAANRDDLYIMGVPPEHLPTERHPFLENPLVVIAPRDHPLAGQRHVELGRLAREPFIAREPGSGTRIAAEKFFASHRIKLRNRMQLGNNEAVKWTVAAGLGVAVISRHALMLEPMPGQLAVLDVQGFPIRRSWYMVYPAGKRLSVVAQTFFEYLKHEAFTIQEELSGPPPRAGKKKPR